MRGQRRVVQNMRGEVRRGRGEDRGEEDRT